jgi:hypothetical protein
LEISFKADVPLSVTTTLEIFDEFGNKIAMPVSLTSDNCVLTTYSYLESNNTVVVFDPSDGVFK